MDRVAHPAGRAHAALPSTRSCQANAAFVDRRTSGFDARFHSTMPQATPRDYRILPARIVLVRHGESEGNIDNITYAQVPDNRVPLTEKGFQQAVEAGREIRHLLDQYHGAEPYRLYFYISPYTRSLQTYLGIRGAFPDDRIAGVQEEVQLREQDFGNFQDPEGKKREKAERLRFGRFFYRFPNGESGADVYDRITAFIGEGAPRTSSSSSSAAAAATPVAAVHRTGCRSLQGRFGPPIELTCSACACPMADHMIRDINAGRFGNNTTLVLVTHGLALRIFLMRWFHWTVDQFLTVYNPENGRRVPSKGSWLPTRAAERRLSCQARVPNPVPVAAFGCDVRPVVLERNIVDVERSLGSSAWVHTKSLYCISEESRKHVKGVTEDMRVLPLLAFIPNGPTLVPTSGPRRLQVPEQPDPQGSRPEEELRRGTKAY